VLRIHSERENSFQRYGRDRLPFSGNRVHHRRLAYDDHFIHFWHSIRSLYDVLLHMNTSEIIDVYLFKTQQGLKLSLPLPIGVWPAGHGYSTVQELFEAYERAFPDGSIKPKK
jgi:hypothetical protein